MDKICAFPSTGEVFSIYREKTTRDQRKCPKYCYRALGHNILSKYSIKKEFVKKGYFQIHIWLDNIQASDGNIT